ncbi:MAG: sigma-70 family RNA polymerase sigma factor [Deltaproteobacteria bacterium]|nr:sigma-70 family RNA polymerase sigma factor [Deltaproteobacteria bacterium]
MAISVINRIRRDQKCLELEDFDDLLQECLAHWHFSKNDYDPSFGANIRTFMARVIEYKLRHIAEKLASDKRKISMESVSLDEPIFDEEGSPTFLDQLTKTEFGSYQQTSLEFKIDISRILKKLTSRQRELCRLLSEEGLNINEASEVLKIPRSTLYEDIKRIKAVFERENLREYF